MTRLDLRLPLNSPRHTLDLFVVVAEFSPALRSPVAFALLSVVQLSWRAALKLEAVENAAGGDRD